MHIIRVDVTFLTEAKVVVGGAGCQGVIHVCESGRPGDEPRTGGVGAGTGLSHIANPAGSLPHMGIAKAAAPEIDRLVWAVNGGVAPKHGPRLAELAREVGLDSLLPFPVTADFLLAGTASVDLICRRMPYSPAETHVARFQELAEMGLVADRDGAVVATERLVPLLETMRGCAADIATGLWSGHEEQMGTVTELAREVALAASDDHTVAVVHRELPAADDPYLRLYDRLVTLRYVRQHDHVVAWQGRNLTAPMIVTLTNLWHGEAVATDDTSAELAARGLALADPVSLTEEGRSLRERIESETNRRAQLAFDVLAEVEATALLTNLRALPGSGG